MGYRPLASQAQFHDLIARFKGFSGPVGSGKSKALCHEAIRLTYSNPGRVGLLGAPTYRMLKDATLISLLEALAEYGVPFKLNRSDMTISMRDTRSVILLRSMTDSNALRGTNLAWFGIDELTYIAEDSWSQLEARLRDPVASEYCGYGVWTPKGADWVHKRFIAGPKKDYGAIFAAPFENRHLVGRNPSYYEHLRNSYSEAEYRQEVLGEYVTGDQNRVYSSFEPGEHLTVTERKLCLPLLWAFDFNVDPMCSIVAQRDGDQLIVLDELVIRRSGTEEMCLEFANRFGDHPQPVKIFGDASGNARSTKGGSDYDIVRRTLTGLLVSQFSFTIPKQNPRVLDRVALVNTRLKTAAGAVRLKIDSRCTELIKDLQQMRFKDGTSVLEKASDPERSHLSDALGYLVWQEYASTRLLGGQSRRLL